MTKDKAGIMYLTVLVIVSVSVYVESENIKDESDELVITVGDLMDMINYENNQKLVNNTRLGKKIADEKIKIDFNSIVGEKLINIYALMIYEL